MAGGRAGEKVDWAPIKGRSDSKRETTKNGIMGKEPRRDCSGKELRLEIKQKNTAVYEYEPNRNKMQTTNDLGALCLITGERGSCSSI